MTNPMSRNAAPPMPQAEEAQRIMKVMQADAQQKRNIDLILDRREHLAGHPLLIRMSAAAKMLGVSRTTVFRLVRAKRLEAVELLPGSRFLRRADVEALANR